MAEDTANDNDAASARALRPDAHGQAAMLLVESLIHSLIERSVLSVSQAIEIVETASEVKIEIAADLGDSPATTDKSLGLLEAIIMSLRSDAPPPDGGQRPKK